MTNEIVQSENCKEYYGIVNSNCVIVNCKWKQGNILAYKNRCEINCYNFLSTPSHL